MAVITITNKMVSGMYNEEKQHRTFQTKKKEILSSSVIVIINTL